MLFLFNLIAAIALFSLVWLMHRDIVSTMFHATNSTYRGMLGLQAVAFFAGCFCLYAFLVGWTEYVLP